jgi:hypothetical protein
MERRTPDAAVADAINRVLAAESEAAAAIVAAQREADALIEAARARRRQILETTRRRASRLHERAQHRLRQSLRELEGGTGTSGTDRDALRRLAQQALARVARRLTAAGHELD